jgi:hypothetical protein
MAVLRDYKCPTHGYFTAWEPKCEHGCDDVAVVFLKAPTMRDSVVGGRSKKNDTNIKQLAKDFNMTNIKSTREGEAQDGYLARNNAEKTAQEKAYEAEQAQRRANGVIWGEAGRYSMQSMLAGGAVKSAMGEAVGFNPKDANLPSKLPTVVHANDPSLKIDKT